MSIKKFSNIKVLDCSLRDGGHINKWNFTKQFAKEYYSAIKNSGIDIVELGYMSTPESMPDSSEFRYLSESLIREIVGEKSGLEIAVMADTGKIKINDFIEKKNSFIDIVRIACYKNQIDEALSLINSLSGMGYKTTINLMGISQYSEGELGIAIEKIKKSSTEIVYIADSFGSLYSDEVRSLIKKLKESKKEIGFHAHNNLQLAFPNSMVAIEAGASYIDSTVNGMGRGAGNLPTEIILPLLNKFNDRYKVIPILELVEGPIKKLKQNLIWGYNLPHLLSGFKSCHPNYALSLKKQGFPIKEIYNILGMMNPDETAGFDRKILEKIITEYRRKNPLAIKENSIKEPVVVLLPCHSGSQRIEEKNTRNFADSSLTEIKLNQLINVPEITQILVFTDDPKVKTICKKIDGHKIKVIEDSRPNVKNNDGLIAHFAERMPGEGHLLWTHVTCPFITEDTYSRAIHQYFKNLDYNTSLVSVKEMKEYIWGEDKKPFSYSLEKDGMWPKTQNIKPLYMINSGIFMLPLSTFRTTKKRLTEKVQYFKCSEIESSDIDWQDDFDRAQLLWRAIQEFEIEKLVLTDLEEKK